MAGDDVARGAALDQADVGGRLLVEPAQLHPRDRRRGGGDRAAAVLGPDPGVGLDPGEVGEDLLLGRGARRSPRRPAPAWSRTKPQSERSAAASKAFAPRSPCSSATVSSSSIPTGGGSAGVAGDQLHEDRDRRLVVGAEDRLAAAAEDAVVLDHLDLARGAARCRCGRRTSPSASLAPGSRASRLPAPASAGPAASSSLTSSPSARSSAAIVSATSRSSPVGLRISQSRTNVSCSLSTAGDRLRVLRSSASAMPTSLAASTSVELAAVGRLLAGVARRGADELAEQRLGPVRAAS